MIGIPLINVYFCQKKAINLSKITTYIKIQTDEKYGMGKFDLWLFKNQL